MQYSVCIVHCAVAHLYNFTRFVVVNDRNVVFVCNYVAPNQSRVWCRDVWEANKLPSFFINQSNFLSCLFWIAAVHPSLFIEYASECAHVLVAVDILLLCEMRDSIWACKICRFRRRWIITIIFLMRVALNNFRKLHSIQHVQIVSLSQNRK